jgi:hypothetical protein
MVYFLLNLFSSYLFIYNPEDFLVYSEYTSRLDTYKPPSILLLILIQYLFKEGLKDIARDSLYYLGRILLYILIIPIKVLD